MRQRRRRRQPLTRVGGALSFIMGCKCAAALLKSGRNWAQAVAILKCIVRPRSRFTVTVNKLCIEIGYRQWLLLLLLFDAQCNAIRRVERKRTRARSRSRSLLYFSYGSHARNSNAKAQVFKFAQNIRVWLWALVKCSLLLLQGSYADRSPFLVFRSFTCD